VKISNKPKTNPFQQRKHHIPKLNISLVQLRQKLASFAHCVQKEDLRKVSTRTPNPELNSKRSPQQNSHNAKNPETSPERLQNQKSAPTCLIAPDYSLPPHPNSNQQQHTTTPRNRS
jgi:hypothetical protein